jgi:hypothetical protein
LVRSISASTILLPIALPPRHLESAKKKSNTTTEIHLQITENSLASEVPKLVLHREHLRDLQSGGAVRLNQEVELKMRVGGVRRGGEIRTLPELFSRSPDRIARVCASCHNLRRSQE